IALRRARGNTEIIAIEATESDQSIFGTFRTRSETGGSYEVEIRSLDAFVNSCGCIDHRVNRLGTCKHVEGGLAALRRSEAKAFRQAAARGSPRVEIFVDRRDSLRLTVTFPPSRQAHGQAARSWLGSFLGADGALDQDPSAVDALLAAWRAAPVGI